MACLKRLGERSSFLVVDHETNDPWKELDAAKGLLNQPLNVTHPSIGPFCPVRIQRVGQRHMPHFKTVHAGCSCFKFPKFLTFLQQVSPLLFPRTQKPTQRWTSFGRFCQESIKNLVRWRRGSNTYEKRSQEAHMFRKLAGHIHKATHRSSLQLASVQLSCFTSFSHALQGGSAFHQGVNVLLMLHHPVLQLSEMFRKVLEITFDLAW